ncbi:hypothetical protein L3i22_061730 [Actinoplanes sp. L3-i22]|nr:hypothetical protein L3i22_061730 [Actinoplanes sp. L3-i22]
MRGPRRPKGRRTPREWTPRRKAILAGGVAGVLALAGVVWVVLPEDQVEPRPREYRDVTACLITDRQGVAGEAAAPVWAAMQAASVQTRGQVRYLAVTGEQTPANAQTFVGTLVIGGCSVIVAVQGIAGDAVRSVAAQQSQQQFVVVGGDASGAANVSRVDLSQVEALINERLSGG